MDTKLCRICGKLSENYVHIFKTEGLKNKIETCLPIIVSPHCLLPDTTCSECLENVDNFYSFIKNCLQNIIVLEAQYDIMESCLKTKRKHEKGCNADFSLVKYDKNIQTDEDYTDLLLQKQENADLTMNVFDLNNLVMENVSRVLTNAENILKGRELEPSSSTTSNLRLDTSTCSLVNYEIESDVEEPEEDNNQSIGKVTIIPKTNKNKSQTSSIIPQYLQKTDSFEDLFVNQKRYFDDQENDLINEIAQRRDLKRKNDTISSHRTKIFKMDTSNRRKSRQPKKVTSNKINQKLPSLTFSNLEKLYQSTENLRLVNSLEEDKMEREWSNNLPQACLLCDMQFGNSTTLATHVYEMHGIDMAQVVSSEPVMERKKKIPNLVKITDLKSKNETQDTTEEPPKLQPTFVCPICPAVLTNRTDLFSHLKVKHTPQAACMCGLCLYIGISYGNLLNHLETCKPQHSITSKYICKICSYYDDNSKIIENHIAVHNFVVTFCKKEGKIFDPSDYIEVNNHENCKNYLCTVCNQSDFVTFKEFSTHRRSQHQIFHCDLCNKFYGRNSHLWKHVNRLHKGHPSITCHLCYKTSASKYHLAQHINKIHSAKPFKHKQNESAENEFINQKFQGFDFQSVRQSFMRQELLEEQSDGEDPEDVSLKMEIKHEEVDFSDAQDEDSLVASNDPQVTLPKEIDTTSHLYTNIITNYTPPENIGEYKCPKCFKGFHRRTLLKKHKKNCRPRSQKDLLTRCKSCSRIFKDRQSLAKHLINYHSEYTCEICGQKVQSKCEIVSHIRFSHPSCHLVCFCGNILRNKKELVEHQSEHRSNFVCQFCGDMLPTKIKLKMHILSLHRKILSLSCGICLKLFETQHILKDHVRLVHKNELVPFISCTVCGKNYGSKWKTYDHLNKSHGRIFKACKLCLDLFDSDEALDAHLENSHNIPSKMGETGTSSLPNAQKQKQTYESEGERANSSSELSNDLDLYSQCKGEGNLSEDEDSPMPVKLLDLPDFSKVENRISLLEKRLLGNKKMIDEDIPSSSLLTDKTHVSSSSAQKKPPKMKIEYLKFREKRYQSKYVDVDPNLQNPSQNSSKRTVYVNSDAPSLCEICLKTWPAKKHLWQHYIRCHKTVAATVCGICLKTNDCYESLQIHLRENHPTLLHGQGFGSNFICRICGRYHNASSKLKLHMAIHENFDINILEQAPSVSGCTNGTSSAVKSDEAPSVNGYVNDEHRENVGINFESLIEQVECSSDSDVTDIEECTKDFKTNDVVHSSSVEESDNESVISLSEENSLESQMLQNMLKEKFDSGPIENLTNLQGSDIKREYTSSDSEDSSDSNQSGSDSEVEDNAEVKSSSDEDSSEYSQFSQPIQIVKQEIESSDNGNIFIRKPEELDSAIRSISYEHITNVDEPVDVDICEIQPQSLNQHEIQSAVDSIL